MARSVNPRLLAMGQRIREIRESRGVSQEDFALETGLARSYFSGIERGRRNVAALNLMRIAESLECEVGDFFPRLKELRRLT
jgi:transcriptional regulator with XRE-family HTH domain